MKKAKTSLSGVGLFSGIGGFELGFKKAGISSELLCEIDPFAKEVLKKAFKDSPIKTDITELRSIPSVDVIAAGFPCQNLSLAGDNKGIHGKKSGLVSEVFRLIKNQKSLKWLVLENVPFMLWHKKGEAILHLIQTLESMGFRWAYRIVDTRAFGLPQRRRRVIFVASKTQDPRTVLFVDNKDPLDNFDDGKVPCGFYWTEGSAGLGWGINCTPTLKPGSAVGIPSPPAIWIRKNNKIITPNISDAERLQGFRPSWTNIKVNEKSVRVGYRWRLVGNAVSVPVTEWLGKRLVKPGNYMEELTKEKWSGGTLPNAAWGWNGSIYPVSISEYPVRKKYIGLSDFLKYTPNSLSIRAAAGFLKRARNSSLRFSENFLEAVEHHQMEMSKLELTKF